MSKVYPDPNIPKIVIPMVRRVWPELIAHDIVGVQPMSGPSGFAFAARFGYRKVYFDEYLKKYNDPLHINDRCNKSNCPIYQLDGKNVCKYCEHFKYKNIIKGRKYDSKKTNRHSK